MFINTVLRNFEFCVLINEIKTKQNEYNMNVLVNKHNRVNPVSGPRGQQKGVESFFGLYYSSS